MGETRKILDREKDKEHYAWDCDNDGKSDWVPLNVCSDGMTSGHAANAWDSRYSTPSWTKDFIPKWSEEHLEAVKITKTEDELCEFDDANESDCACDCGILAFTKQSRKAFLKEILNLMKSWLTAKTDDNVYVTFTEMLHLRKGFGYKMVVEQVDDGYDTYIQAVDFARNMLFYMLGGKIDAACYDDEHSTTFEIVSQI